MPAIMPHRMGISPLSPGNGDEELYSLVRSELERRGVQPASLLAFLTVNHSIEEAASRIGIVLADVLLDAKDQVSNRKVMRQVWEGLTDRKAA